MYKAVTLDENGDARKEEEVYQRLITENKVNSLFAMGLIFIFLVYYSNIPGSYSSIH